MPMEENGDQNLVERILEGAKVEAEAEAEVEV